MSKSIHAIVGLGAAACVVMSLIMKNLVEVQQQRAVPQLQERLETKFASQLIGPVRVTEETVEGRLRLVASARVTVGLAKARFAEGIGATMWQQVSNAGMSVKEVQVVVSDERGPPESFLIPPPSWPR